MSFEVVLEGGELTSGKDEGETKRKSEAAVSLAEETLLSDRECRDLLLNDLGETETFIQRRLQELKGREQATFTTYEESKKPAILQENDNAEFLTLVLQSIKEASQILTSKRLYMLLNLKHNPLYVNVPRVGARIVSRTRSKDTSAGRKSTNAKPPGKKRRRRRPTKKWTSANALSNKN